MFTALSGSKFTSIQESYIKTLVLSIDCSDVTDETLLALKSRFCMSPVDISVVTVPFIGWPYVFGFLDVSQPKSTITL